MISRIHSIAGVILILCACWAVLSSCFTSPTLYSPPQKPDCWEPLETLPDTVQGSADDHPEWSTNGDRILFFSFFDSCNEINPGLYTTKVDGSDRKSLENFFSYHKWLPGDTQLIVNLGFVVGGELAIYDLRDRTVEKLNAPTAVIPFDVSSDGRYAYYIADSFWVCELDLETRISKRLTKTGGHISISPDRTMLAFGHNNKTALFRFSDSSIITYSNIGYPGDWLPEGSGFFYALPERIIFADTLGNETVVVQGGTRTPSMSPNGREFVYVNVGSDNYAHIWRFNITTGQSVQVTE